MGGLGRAAALRLAGVVVLGVALRALYLATVGRDVTGSGDWFFYHWQANALADGLGFVDPFRLRFEGLELPSAAHPPLYPLVLSGVSELGGTGVGAHRGLGLALGGLTILLVGLLGRRVGGERVGLAAAALYAVYPAMVAVDGALMSETLYGPLVAGVLLSALSLASRPRRRVALGLGALIGLAALTRSEALALVPFLGWVVAWRARGGSPRRAVLTGALVAAGCALVIAPWTLRNLDAFGRLVPISNNDSTVIRGANCPPSYFGVGTGGWEFTCLSPRREDNEAEQAAIWREEGLDYARTNLGRLAVVVPIRLLRVWDLWQPRRQVAFAEGRAPRVQQAGVVAYFALVVGAAFGVGRLRGSRLVLLIPFGVICLAAMVGYGVPRLRHLAEIPLVVLAGAGVVALLDRRRSA